MEPIDELMGVFREEAADFIDRIAVQVENLRGKQDEELRAGLDVAMRLSHNLKGAACTVGLTAIENLAHAIEDALKTAIEDRATPTEA